jgi:hypothetical protein
MKNLSGLLDYFNTPTLYIDDSFFLIIKNEKIEKLVSENFFDFINTNQKSILHNYSIFNIILNFSLCKPISIKIPDGLINSKEKITFIDQFISKNYSINLNKAINYNNFELVGISSELHINLIKQYFYNNKIIINQINPFWSSTIFLKFIKLNTNIIFKDKNLFHQIKYSNEILSISDLNNLDNVNSYYEILINSNTFNIKKFTL